MIHTIQPFLHRRFKKCNTVSVKKCLLKIGGILFFGLGFMPDSHASSREISEGHLFSLVHPSRTPSSYRELQEQQRQKIEKIQEIGKQRALDKQIATGVIEGVIDMFGENVDFGVIRYTFEPLSTLEKVNASYRNRPYLGDGVFDFPWVNSGNEPVYYTARDQGIVSHEAGHMILFHLIGTHQTAHIRAFHEAFGDLTAHFYRYYNPKTRQNFLSRLDNGQGCVGDNGFSCVRNNHQVAALSQVGCEEHDLSKPFSNAVYDNMTTAYRNRGWFSNAEAVGGQVVAWHKRALVEAVLSLRPSIQINLMPTLMDFAQAMLKVSYRYPNYREELGQNFIRNGLIVLIYRTLQEAQYTPNQSFIKLCQEKNNLRRISYRR